MKISRKSGLIFGNTIGIIVIISSLFNHDYIGIFFIMIWLILWNLILCIPKLAKLIHSSEKTITDYSYIKNNLQLYRGIISEYSIGELSLIDEYYFTFPKDVVAILLKLELNRKIEILNGKIVVLNNNDVKESEKYILDHITNGYLQIDMIDELEDIIKDELKKDKLLKFREEDMPIPVLIYFILFFVFLFLLIKGHPLSLVGFVFIFIGGIFITAKYGRKDHLWRLTQKGKEINLELRGLKKFLNSFSEMDNKQKEELALWEDYLIYSVIFGINTKIVDEYKKLIIYKE